MTTYWLVWDGGPYRGPRRRELDNGRLLRPDPWEPGVRFPPATRQENVSSEISGNRYLGTTSNRQTSYHAVASSKRHDQYAEFTIPHFVDEQKAALSHQRSSRSSRLCEENSMGWRNWYHLGQERPVWVASHQERSSQQQPGRDTHV